MKAGVFQKSFFSVYRPLSKRLSLYAIILSTMKLRNPFAIPAFLFLPLMAVAITLSCNSQAQQTGVHNVDVSAFKQLVDTGKGIILDVRTQEEVDAGTIPNASVVDFYSDDFETKINLMDKSKDIYVYCHSGGRSSKAAAILVNNGFKNVYNLEGGITAWSGAGYSVTPSIATEDTHIKKMTLEEFKQLLATDLPVLVDFHTKWCAPCRQMAPVVDKLEKEFSGKAVVVRIDVDRSPEVAAAYKVKGVPVFTVFRQGDAKWSHQGIIAEDELRKQLQ